MRKIFAVITLLLVVAMIFGCTADSQQAVDEGSLEQGIEEINTDQSALTEEIQTQELDQLVTDLDNF